MSTVTVSTRKSAKVKRSRYTPVSDLPSAATCTDSDSTATRTGTDNYWNWPSAATRTDSDDYRIGLNPRPIHVGLNPRPVWPFSTVQAGWMRWQPNNATFEEYANRFVFIILYYYKHRKTTTFRTCFPCRRHNRYFNFATLGNKQKTVASHSKRRGISFTRAGCCIFSLGFFLSLQII